MPDEVAVLLVGVPGRTLQRQHAVHRVGDVLEGVDEGAVQVEDDAVEPESRPAGTPVVRIVRAQPSASSEKTSTKIATVSTIPITAR